MTGSKRVLAGQAVERPEYVRQLAELATTGAIRPVIDRRYEFSQMAEGLLYDERDPAVLAAIRAIIKRAHRAGLAVSICGQAPSVHPEYAEFLVRCGIDSISVVPDAIEQTRANIARAELRVLLDCARR